MSVLCEGMQWRLDAATDASPLCAEVLCGVETGSFVLFVFRCLGLLFLDISCGGAFALERWNGADLVLGSAECMGVVTLFFATVASEILGETLLLKVCQVVEWEGLVVLAWELPGAWECAMLGGLSGAALMLSAAADICC
ncbi:hypothetical protein Nepgr_011599 [Nepenthes gracilis]|uniref:Uncharacterized protein n=1 Tax=Nepenthes gracilis TaxID=150966 RepID=A0AAD3SEM2_NEPGR|nr:hypothetical protein Nepgr_011599 [Nepenthes gracilis]